MCPSTISSTSAESAQLEHNLNNQPLSETLDNKESVRSTSDLEKEKKEDDCSTIPQPLRWDGPNDPEDPHNWSIWKKLYLLNTTGFLCLAITLGTAVVTGGIREIQQSYSVSETASYLSVSLYIVGLALGPTLGAPISEIYGRKIVYLATLPLSMCMAVGSALSPTFAGHLICRFLCALLGSPVLAVSAGTIADIFKPLDQGIALAYFCATGPFIGSAIGAVVGGYMAHARNWKWTIWLSLMVSGVTLIMLLFIKESYMPIILKKRALKRGQELPAKLPIGVALKMVATITLTRPLRMLVCDPIVASLSIYSAFVFAVLMGFFEAIPYIFIKTYGFTVPESGLVFIGICTGFFLSVLIHYILERLFYFPRALKALELEEKPAAEWRLYSAFVGAVLLPSALFWVGWSARSDVHWIVPALGTVPFGAALTLLFISITTYLVDCYGPLLGASALAANNLLRYTIACTFPLFAKTMYENLGISWASSLLGFISLGLLPLPFLMYKFGPKWRAIGIKNMGL
ncbi:major facilitator superfamily domain-containing protein [Myxozyma melibiosi]|uniref:Major facilitator superfamily domain-containing protein n=1 Tax=Myxozyma melibiosi TaxID=54550 RepID=A0ABR1FEH8_9ASCO